MATLYALTVPLLILMLASFGIGQDEKFAKVVAECKAQSDKDMKDAKPDQVCEVNKKWVECFLKGLPEKPTEEEVEQLQAELNSKISENQTDCKIDVQAIVNDHYKNAGVTVFSMSWWQRTAMWGVPAALVLRAF